MGIIWSYQLFFLFFGPEISQEERQEHEDSATYLEEMRKRGVSLRDIGIQRVKTHDTDGRVLQSQGNDDDSDEKSSATHDEGKGDRVEEVKESV